MNFRYNNSPLRLRAFFCKHVVWFVCLWLIAVLTACVLPMSTEIQPSWPYTDKLVHGFFYAVPAFLLGYAGRLTVCWAVFLWLFGVSIECLQSILAYRSGDVYDVMANTAGLMVGILAARLLPRDKAAAGDVS